MPVEGGAQVWHTGDDVPAGNCPQPECAEGLNSPGAGSRCPVSSLIISAIN